MSVGQQLLWKVFLRHETFG